MARKTSSGQVMMLLTLLSVTMAADWQASGFRQGGWPGEINNNREPNLAQVYLEIDKVKENTVHSTYEAAQNLSSALNELWDPAWNVVVGQLFTRTSDFVLYGYAFRHHWMWINNLDRLCFVIWKDFNCQAWVHYDEFENRTRTSVEPWGTQISSYFDQQLGDLTNLEGQSFPPNAWWMAYKFNTWAEDQSPEPDTFSTVIYVGEPGIDVSTFSASVCGKDGGNWIRYSNYFNYDSRSQAYTIFTYQTRDGHYMEP